MQMKPNKLVAQSTPRFVYIAVENIGNAAAKIARAKEHMARALLACRRYTSTR